MGRDFFDVVFLLKQVKPNYKYLEQKLQITNEVQLKRELFTICKNIDLKAIAKDVEPFLFFHNDLKIITLFREYVEQADMSSNANQ